MESGGSRGTIDDCTYLSLWEQSLVMLPKSSNRCWLGYHCLRTWRLHPLDKLGSKDYHPSCTSSQEGHCHSYNAFHKLVQHKNSWSNDPSTWEGRIWLKFESQVKKEYLLLGRIVRSNPMGEPDPLVIFILVTPQVHPRECGIGNEDANNDKIAPVHGAAFSLLL